MLSRTFRRSRSAAADSRNGQRLPEIETKTSAKRQQPTLQGHRNFCPLKESLAVCGNSYAQPKEVVMRPNIGKAILGGFVGTLAITLMMYKVGPMMGLMKMDIAESLGKTMGMGWMVGMILHFMNSTIIFPLIYAFPLYRVLPAGPTARGTIWGVILW